MFGEGCDFTYDTICTGGDSRCDYLNGRRIRKAADWCRRYPWIKERWRKISQGRDSSLSTSAAIHISFGNGSAMRVSPVAWLFDRPATGFGRGRENGIFLPITIPKESREPKPWLMPSGISRKSKFSEESTDAQGIERSKRKPR